ncbi:MAG: hypothetical protein WBC91_20625, partial [Phototrophicaceae bacterium]
MSGLLPKNCITLVFNKVCSIASMFFMMALFIIISSISAQTRSLSTTFADNNGCDGGNMFDITTTNAITITSFDINTNGGAVSVYYKTGS